MLSALQITAILYLLVAFGVPATTVNNVQGILERAGRTTQSVTPQLQTAPQGIGGVGSVSVQDCTPVLEASVTLYEGSINTGTIFMFNGTSTLPVGCTVDMNTPVTLQTPSGKYIGTIGGWLNNGGNHVRLTNGGFSYQQGWGTPPNVVPSGQFTWTVSNVSTTTSI